MKLFTILSYLLPACLFTSCHSQQPVSSAITTTSGLQKIVDEKSIVTKVAGGFQFVEGPVWAPDGYLLFSDIPAGKIYKIQNDSVSVYLSPSGNSNGLAFDQTNALISCEHGTRSIRRTSQSKSTLTLAGTYQGKKFNSPNDLAIHSDGSIYFTDPPFGLQGQDQDPAKELGFNGIYRLKDGVVTLLDTSLVRPNGLAFSLDEKTLYVSQSEKKLLWKKFDVTPDGRLVNGKIFFDASLLPGKGYCDGLKLDQQGNLYCTGPGGIVMFSSLGQHLGTLSVPEITSNCAFGGADNKTLFITAGTSVYKVPLKIAGAVTRFK